MLIELLIVVGVFLISFVLFAIGYLISGKVKLAKRCSDDPKSCSYCAGDEGEQCKKDVAKQKLLKFGRFWK